MSVVLLDTTVASLLHPKKQGDLFRNKYEDHMRGHTLALSFQSVSELWDWAESNRWSDTSRRRLDVFIRELLVIPFDYELAQTWARVMETSRKKADDSMLATAGSLRRPFSAVSRCSHMTGISWDARSRTSK